jgi:hypothetical protein
MEHMPNSRDQPQRALRNLLMKPDTVFAMIYDAVLRACHDHHGHTQFPIAVLHCGHGRTSASGNRFSTEGLHSAVLVSRCQPV